MFNKEEKQIIVELISKRKGEIERLLETIEQMGDHFYINEGLVNEANLKRETYKMEIETLSNILKKME